MKAGLSRSKRFTTYHGEHFSHLLTSISFQLHINWILKDEKTQYCDTRDATWHTFTVGTPFLRPSTQLSNNSSCQSVNLSTLTGTALQQVPVLSTWVAFISFKQNGHTSSQLCMHYVNKAVNNKSKILSCKKGYIGAQLMRMSMYFLSVWGSWFFANYTNLEVHTNRHILLFTFFLYTCLPFLLT